MGLRIKKNDTVLVITGKEKGKKGRVLSVSPSKNRLLVEKVNIIKRHMKPSRKYTQGGIIEKEALLHISNVMLICPKCSKPTRISNTILQDDKKARLCKKCREVIDS
ncbi:MAG: 50S ribosomal protein L24 [Nitrospirae bacterium]|jgi:large subunit ribosomal protein L24|nr:50S ribosomal protein L24 [Nitrospirota bacterium]